MGQVSVRVGVRVLRRARRDVQLRIALLCLLLVLVAQSLVPYRGVEGALVVQVLGGGPVHQADGIRLAIHSTVHLPAVLRRA